MQNKEPHIIFSPMNFICMFLITLLQRSVCVFYNYSLHSKPPVLGSSYACMLHETDTFFCHSAEVGVKIFLIELPYGEHVLFSETLDHKDLILLRNLYHAHVHYYLCLALEWLMLRGCHLLS
jgi:hypothetical protein